MRKLVLGLVGAIMLAAPATAAIKYNVTILQTLPGDARTSTLQLSSGLNEAGQSVGFSSAANGANRSAVRWAPDGSAFALEEPAGATFAYGGGINNAGVVVGVTDPIPGIDNGEDDRAARWNAAGQLELFVPDNGFRSSAFFINDRGWITGDRNNDVLSSRNQTAFVYSPDGNFRWISGGQGKILQLLQINESNATVGVLTDINTGVFSPVRWTEAGGLVSMQKLSSANSFAQAINEAGISSGYGFDANGIHRAVKWDANGAITALAELPNHVFSQALGGINDAGVIVGATQFAGCGPLTRVTCRRATMWDAAGAPVNLNDLIDPALNFTLLVATGVNNKGQIYGEGLFADGRRRAFLLNAVPEPATWALMIAGFGLVGHAARRRRVSVSYA